MFLSHLMIDVGINPDRPRPGRLWLRNPYHIHQRLSMAFPSEDQVNQDPHFLAPYQRQNFDQVRFLFRVDNSIEAECPRAIILVQSEAKPDWDYAFHNARMFLAADPAVREYNPRFNSGDCCRFRIRANLSKKSMAHRRVLTTVDTTGRPQSQGKRVALTWDSDQDPNDVIGQWFAGKMSGRGCEMTDCRLLHMGWVKAFQRRSRPSDSIAGDGKCERQMKFLSGLLEGTLRVSEPDLFQRTITSGVGSAKAFGFGLLTVVQA